MKYQNIFVYAIIAIGLLAIPALLESGSAQTNSTNQTSTQNKTMSNDTQTSQNKTMSNDTQALMSMDLPGLKDNLENAKQSLVTATLKKHSHKLQILKIKCYY